MIRAIRERIGLSQRDAGLVFGTGETSFEKYESGETCPSGPTRRLPTIAIDHPEWFKHGMSGQRSGSPMDEAETIRQVPRDSAMGRLYAPLFNRRAGLTEPA